MDVYCSWVILQPSADANLASSQLAILFQGMCAVPDFLFSFLSDVR
jgi:hypothetical protein